MTYVDGFVLPVPADRIDDYRAMAEKAGAIWIAHGALSFVESVADDTGETGFCLSFPAAFAAHMKAGEVLLFSFITFRSREHRDEVNAKVMADPRMKDACGADGTPMPFDVGRMAYGGFKTLVEF